LTIDLDAMRIASGVGLAAAARRVVTIDERFPVHRLVKREGGHFLRARTIAEF